MSKKCKNNFLSKFLGVSKLHAVDFMRIWTHYDQDSSGYLDSKELSGFLKDFMFQRSGKEETEENIEAFRLAVLQLIDTNRDGKVELGEFARLIPIESNFMEQFSKRKSLSRKEFEDIFGHYDPDGNGFIEGKELMALIRDIMCKSENNVKMKDVEDYKEIALRVFDKNADGRLSRKELGLFLSVDR